MPQFNQQGKIHPAVATIIVIVLIGIVASVAIAVQSDNETPITTTQNSTSETSSTETDTSSTDTSSYENGTYSATGSYVTPGGVESIELTVTIEDGVIISTSLVQNGEDRETQQYQEAFASGYAELVVGKNVDEVSLSRVAGSSLTSNGFNDALDQIKEDATA